MRSELVSRNVGVTMDLDPGLPPVRGDRVQLQQVLLNLVFNACEAMAEVPAGARSLTLRTALAGPGHVGVYVSDCNVAKACRRTSWRRSSSRSCRASRSASASG